ncbi:MAG TPA: hypothetical protein VF784_15060, partial [Anaerolineales bacterium]
LKRTAAVFALGVLCLVATACSFPAAAPTPFILPTQPPPSPAAASPTPAVSSPSATPALFPTISNPAGTQVFVTLVPVTQIPVTQIAVTQVPATQVPPAVFCADTQATTLIDNFKKALKTSDGTLLASLVSPTHGMDARLYRDGRIVNYDTQHAKFLFETTFSVDWGAAPGSGQETMGSFHELIIPDLLDVFTRSYSLTCNQVQVGGTTYQATWPYSGINFYSVYFPGTTAKGNMDWHTWLLGMHYVNGSPYLYAIMQFKWEP